MDLNGKVAVVTGGGSGIGEASSHRFATAGAKVLVVDQHADRVERVAAAINASGGVAAGYAADIRAESATAGAIAHARELWGPVDLFFANAGIGVGGGEEVPDEEWLRIWEINVMPHVHAARVLVPEWLESGAGYLVTTASAAALLTTLDSAAYAVTKSAALSFAEWISIKYGDRGIGVSCLCPQGVRTRMTMGEDLSGDGVGDAGMAQLLASGAIMEPADVAEVVHQAIVDGTFLILPHPEVATYFQRKATDYERWLGGMRRLRARSEATGAS